MSNSNLNIPTVELVSTLRAAPQNGPTNSQDYNDSWTEALADLASLSGFINDILLPMLNGLSSNIQPINVATPFGLEGRFIFSDTTDTTQLFFDDLTNSSLSVADSLRILNGIVQGVETTLATLNVEVTAIQTQLSATNQNDIAQALQNFANSLSALTNQVVSNTTQINNNIVDFQTNGVDNGSQLLLNLIAGTNVSLINSGGNVTINATATNTAAGSTTQVQINNAGVLYADAGFTYTHTSGIVAIAGTEYVGPLDASFSSFSGGAPAFFDVSQTDALNRFGVINQSTSSGEDVALGIINQDNFAGGSSGWSGLNSQAWSTNTGTITVNAIVFPDVVVGAILQAHHIGTGNLAGTNNGPVGALISATHETAATISAATAAVLDIGNSGSGTIGTATGLWIASLGDPGNTINLSRAIYIAPQVAGAAVEWALYVDGITPSWFGGTVNMGNNTPAISITNENSSIIDWQGNYWNGSASAIDNWNAQAVLGTGTNPTSTWQLSHSGSTGLISANIQAPLQIQGLTVPIVTKTSSYLTQTTDHTVETNSTGAVTVTLLTTGIAIGQIYVVKNINTGTTTVQGQTGTIDGNATVSLIQNQAAVFQWDGTTWRTISQAVTGSSAIGGSISTRQVAFGSATDIITGSPNFLYSPGGSLTLSQVGGSGSQTVFLIPSTGISFQNEILANNDGSLTFLTGTGNAQMFLTSGGVIIGANSTTRTSLQFNGASGGAAQIGVAAVAGSPHRMNLPTTTGTTGQVLTTDGGNPQQLSWTTVSGGGGGTIGGSIASGQVAVGSGTNTIAGSSALTSSGTLLTIGEPTLGTSLALALTTQTGNYSTTVNDYTVLVNASALATITLTTTGINVGQLIKVKNLSTNSVVVQGQTGNVDGGASITMTSQYQALEFQWDGTNWWIF